MVVCNGHLICFFNLLSFLDLLADLEDILVVSLNIWLCVLWFTAAHCVAIKLSIMRCIHPIGLSVLLIVANQLL